jgi:acyl-coenzyme A synthetase/AMP-(fatty) acid ligase
VAPNLPIDWDTARRRLEGLPGGGLNIAHEAVDRHARGALAQKTAIRWLGASGMRQEISYAELSALSSRFANLFRALGIVKGDRIIVLCGRIPEHYAAVLGGLKCGAAVLPLFSQFGPEPLKTRINIGRGKLLVTTESREEGKGRKIAAGEMPTLAHVLVVDSDELRNELNTSTSIRWTGSPSWWPCTRDSRSTFRKPSTRDSVRWIRSCNTSFAMAVSCARAREDESRGHSAARFR